MAWNNFNFRNHVLFPAVAVIGASAIGIGAFKTFSYANDKLFQYLEKIAPIEISYQNRGEKPGFSTGNLIWTAAIAIKEKRALLNPLNYAGHCIVSSYSLPVQEIKGAAVVCWEDRKDRYKEEATFYVEIPNEGIEPILKSYEYANAFDGTTILATLPKDSQLISIAFPKITQNPQVREQILEKMDPKTAIEALAQAFQ